MNRLNMKRYSFVITLCLLVFCTACGKKGDPLPQKVNQLFSLQNVFIIYNPEGTLSVQGTIVGAIQNVQAFTLELEAVEEDCIGCPFVPAEKHSETAQAVWGDRRHSQFSFSILPHTKSDVYRWRLVVYNAVSGLTNAVTPVYKVNKPFEETRDFVEIKQGS